MRWRGDFFGSELSIFHCGVTHSLVKDQERGKGKGENI